MARYIEFSTSDGYTILVEVEQEEVSPPQGVVKAGVREAAQKSVAVAQTAFEDAVEQVVRHNAEALIKSVRNLSEPPDELEVTFGLKATGEVGNFAIAKGGTELNFTVKLLWKRGSKESSKNEI
jgi:hypothetical protein